jgi:hypothetical protein
MAATTLIKAFEFDGETYAPITTGLPDDRPNFIAIHKNMLFLSYGSSVIYSGIGTPFKYLTVDGGGEIAVGDDITGLLSTIGSQSTATLLVFQRRAAPRSSTARIPDFQSGDLRQQRVGAALQLAGDVRHLHARQHGCGVVENDAQFRQFRL